MKNENLLILCTNDDPSANELLMWAQKFNYNNILRLNDEDIITDLKITLNNNSQEFFINGNNILNYKNIWIRNGQLPYIKIKNNLEESEFKVIKDFILFNLEKFKNCIGSISEDLNHNKLIDLQYAKKVGLDIPDNWIINHKKDLQCIFSDINIEVLIKPLKNYYIEKEFEYEYILDLFELDKLPKSLEKSFFPSLVQKKIPKLFEVRVFFLKDKFYSIAIFSQKNKKTQLSFKFIDKNLMNRMVPFNLPPFLKTKLIQFFELKKMNTGSIDLIYSTDKKFYFLEVNPIGQFNWLSKVANYQIEKEILSHLNYIK